MRYLIGLCSLVACSTSFADDDYQEQMKQAQEKVEQAEKAAAESKEKLREMMIQQFISVDHCRASYRAGCYDQNFYCNLDKSHEKCVELKEIDVCWKEEQTENASREMLAELKDSTTKQTDKLWRKFAYESNKAVMEQDEFKQRNLLGKCEIQYGPAFEKLKKTEQH